MYDRNIVSISQTVVIKTLVAKKKKFAGTFRSVIVRKLVARKDVRA